MCAVTKLIPQVTSGKKNAGKSKKHLDPENPEEGQGIELHGECRIYLI